MLKCTLKSAPWLFRTKNLNFDADKLTVVDCTCNLFRIIIGVMGLDI